MAVGDYDLLRRAKSSGKNNIWKRNLQIAEKSLTIKVEKDTMGKKKLVNEFF